MDGSAWTLDELIPDAALQRDVIAMLRRLGFSRAAIFSIPDRAEYTFSVPSDELRLVGGSVASRAMMRVLPGRKAWVTDHASPGQIELYP